MFSQFSLILQRLQQADFLMLLLHPFFVYGMITGTILLAIGLSGKSPIRTAGLICIAASCFMVYPYLQLGRKAIPGNESHLKAQAMRRYDSRMYFYAMGAIAAAALAAPAKMKKMVNYGVFAAAVFMMFFAISLHIKDTEEWHPFVRHAIRK